MNAGKNEWKKKGKKKERKNTGRQPFPNSYKDLKITEYKE